MDSISKEHLTQFLQAPVRPIIIDVRRDDAYAAGAGVIPGALRRDAGAASAWASDLELASTMRSMRGRSLLKAKRIIGLPS